MICWRPLKCVCAQVLLAAHGCIIATCSLYTVKQPSSITEVRDKNSTPAWVWIKKVII